MHLDLHISTWKGTSWHKQLTDRQWTCSLAMSQPGTTLEMPVRRSKTLKTHIRPTKRHLLMPQTTRLLSPEQMH